MPQKNVECQQKKNRSHHQIEHANLIKLRSPTVLDGYAITTLINSSPPLDSNSSYCNLLQCSHFSQTCVVVELNGSIVGWLSAYLPPDQPGVIFIWQVVVHKNARGQGLVKNMIYELLSREDLLGVRFLNTTITEDNQASWRAFESFAKSHQLALNKSPHFEKELHFKGVHDNEFLVEIGPFEIPDILKR
ncbi:MAG: L-2,4-diaminobutyric acid acetyltransferase [Methylophilaceae bacterium]